jgi:uncharacterized RDD family membrane protein YckC
VTDLNAPIVTPEAVVLDFETAGVGSRSIAKLIDVIVQLITLFGILMVVGIGAGASDAGGTVIAVVMFISSFLVLFGYPVAIETLWNGRTLGKAAMGVRAVTREGAPIRFRHAAIRGVIGIVEVYIFGFIAVITAALSRHDQRVGDLAAGTIVIRERSAASHAVSLAFYVPPGYESYADSLDVAAVDARQYQVIRSFLTRVLQLSPDARAAMAFRLANPVAVELDHEPPPGIGPELFLVCVAAAYQKRHGGGAPPATEWAPAWSPQQPGWSAPTGWGPPTAPGYGWGADGQPPYAGGPATGVADAGGGYGNGGYAGGAAAGGAYGAGAHAGEPRAAEPTAGGFDPPS